MKVRTTVPHLVLCTIALLVGARAMRAQQVVASLVATAQPVSFRTDGSGGVCYQEATTAEVFRVRANGALEVVINAQELRALAPRYLPLTALSGTESLRSRSVACSPDDVVFLMVDTEASVGSRRGVVPFQKRAGRPVEALFQFGSKIRMDTGNDREVYEMLDVDYKYGKFVSLISFRNNLFELISLSGNIVHLRPQEPAHITLSSETARFTAMRLSTSTSRYDYVWLYYPGPDPIRAGWDFERVDAAGNRTVLLLRQEDDAMFPWRDNPTGNSNTAIAVRRTPGSTGGFLLYSDSGDRTEFSSSFLPAGHALTEAGEYYVTAFGGDVYRYDFTAKEFTRYSVLGLPKTEEVYASGNQLYFLENAGGSLRRIYRITTTGNPAISSFTADPAEIAAGDSTTLRWQVSEATSVRLDPGNFDVTRDQSRVVRPDRTTTYTLTATNLVGAVTRTVTVGVGMTRPSFAASSVVNAASFLTGLAPGTLGTIYGTNFAAEEAVAGLPLPTTLGNVRVQVNGRNAPLLYVNPGQINFQMPFDVEPGLARVQVFRGAFSSSEINVLTFSTSPGVFQHANAGIVTDSQNRLIAMDNPCTAGSVCVLWATGLGATNPPVATGQTTPLVDRTEDLSRVRANIRLTIAGQNAQILFAGLTPGFVGLYQVNFVMPQGGSSRLEGVLQTMNSIGSVEGQHRFVTWR